MVSSSEFNFWLPLVVSLYIFLYPCTFLEVRPWLLLENTICQLFTKAKCLEKTCPFFSVHTSKENLYDFRSWDGETGFVHLAIGNYFLAVDRKWSGHWRFSGSEAFRVRVWYTLWAMLRHIAWTSWNRIGKKRHTRNRLFALKMGYFLSSVSAFPSGSFKSREKWSFV